MGKLVLHLPELRRLTLRGFGWVAGDLEITRHSFREAAKLEYFSTNTPATVSLTRDCFTGVTALATLRLEACRLSSIPSALTALSGSLTSLALPNNDDLQLSHYDTQVLLALPKLQKLDLRKAHCVSSMRDRETVVTVSPAFKRAGEIVVSCLAYDPPLWSQRSLQQLVELPNAYLALHGHTLALQVYDENERRG